MNTKQVARALRDCPQFRGVFARDQLVPLKKPFAVVVNTDSGSEPGEHWVAIYAPASGHCEYFDPMGWPPAHPQLLRYLNQLTPKFVYCCQPVQGIGSDKCGHYCIAFIKARAKRKSYQTFVNSFTWDFIENDRRLVAMNKSVVLR
jgi:hypothetical protein